MQETRALSIPVHLQEGSTSGPSTGWVCRGFRPELIAEINVWSTVTHELVRQVYVHCEEQGILLCRARARLLQVRPSIIELYVAGS